MEQYSPSVQPFLARSVARHSSEAYSLEGYSSEVYLLAFFSLAAYSLCGSTSLSHPECGELPDSLVGRFVGRLFVKGLFSRGLFVRGYRILLEGGLE